MAGLITAQPLISKINNMERETKEIITPIGKNKVVVKTWLTGREKRDIKNILLQSTKIKSLNNGKTDIDMMSGDIMVKIEEKTIETIVLSVDGVKDNIVDTVLDMHSNDYDFIKNEVNNIDKDKDFLE